jgi:hypothetical protein
MPFPLARRCVDLGCGARVPLGFPRQDHERVARLRRLRRPAAVLGESQEAQRGRRLALLQTALLQRAAAYNLRTVMTFHQKCGGSRRVCEDPRRVMVAPRMYGGPAPHGVPRTAAIRYGAGERPGTGRSWPQPMTGSTLRRRCQDLTSQRISVKGDKVCR